MHQLKLLNTTNNKFIIVSALADTSAQSNLWGWKDFYDANFGKKNLLLVSITIRVLIKFQLISWELSKPLSVERLHRMVYSAAMVLSMSVIQELGLFFRMKQWLAS